MSGYSSSSSTEGLDEPNGITAPPKSHTAKWLAVESAKRGPSDRFRRERESYYASTPAPELVRLLVAEEYESRKSKRLLDAALSQLDAFSRHVYTNDHERGSEVTRLQQLIQAQQEGAAARQQIELYKVQLANAQAEINRAQHILDMVEKQRDEAEEAAAKARAKARKLNEERLATVARENGRQAGFDEGLRRGRIEAERAIREEEEYWRREMEMQRRIEYRPSPAGGAFIEEGGFSDDEEPPLPVPTPRASRYVDDEDDEEYEITVRPPTVGSSTRKSHVSRVRESDSVRRSPSLAGSSPNSFNTQSRRRTTSTGSTSTRRYDDSRRRDSRDSQYDVHPLQQSHSMGSPNPSMSSRRQEKMPEPSIPQYNAEPEPPPQIPFPVPEPARSPSPPPQPQSQSQPMSHTPSQTLPHFPMPPPPVQSQSMGPSDPGMMPSATIPVGDALRGVRAHHAPEEQMPVPVVPTGDALHEIRARPRTSSTPAPGSTMPVPSVPSSNELAAIRARNESQMPDARVPTNEELSRIRVDSSSSRMGRGMPTPSVPTGEDLRHIRASSRAGQRSVSAGSASGMPVPYVPSSDDLYRIRATSGMSRGEGSMPTPTVPTSDELRNIRVSTSGRREAGAGMPTPTIPSPSDLRNIRVNTSVPPSSGPGSMPTPTVPTGSDLRNIRASTKDSRMPTPSVPSGHDLRNIRVSSTGSSRMPAASVPSADELQNIRAYRDSEDRDPYSSHSRSHNRMPSASTPTNEELRNIRAGAGSTSASASRYDAYDSGRAQGRMPDPAVPSDADLRYIRSRSTSGGMPVPSVPSSDDDLRGVRAHGSGYSSRSVDPVNRTAAGTPAYAMYGSNARDAGYSSAGSSTDHYATGAGQGRSSSGHGYHHQRTTSDPSQPQHTYGHHRRPSSPESMSSVATGTSMNLVSFPTADVSSSSHHQPSHHHGSSSHHASRQARGLSVIPEATTEGGSSRGSYMSSSGRRAEEERVRREMVLEQERRKKEAERAILKERKEAEMKQWARTRSAAANAQAAAAPGAYPVKTDIYARTPTVPPGEEDYFSGVHDPYRKGEREREDRERGGVDEWRRAAGSAQTPTQSTAGYPATSYGAQPSSGSQRDRDRGGSQQPMYPTTSYGAASTTPGANPWGGPSQSDLLSPGGHMSGDSHRQSRVSSVSSGSIAIDVEPPSRPASEASDPDMPSTNHFLSPNISGNRPLPGGGGSSGGGRNQQQQQRPRSVVIAPTDQIVHVSNTSDAPLPPGFVPATPVVQNTKRMSTGGSNNNRNNNSNNRNSTSYQSSYARTGGGSPIPVIPGGLDDLDLPAGFVPTTTTNNNNAGATTPRAGRSPLPGMADLPPGFVPTSPLPTGVGLGINYGNNAGDSSGGEAWGLEGERSQTPVNNGNGGGGQRSRRTSGVVPIPMTPSQTYATVSSPPGGAGSGFARIGGDASGNETGVEQNAGVSPSMFAKTLGESDTGMKVTGKKGKKGKKGK